ncbi:MAG: serine--tRNA ligase [Capsulimonadaceae bacterium]|nr:serine--tRNA ligase [Capsulimonadaceae bacterium]
MLDIRLIRTSPDQVVAALSKRMPEDQARAKVDEVRHTDELLRKALQESEELKAEVNSASKSIGLLMREGKADEAAKVKDRVRVIKESQPQRDALARELDEAVQSKLGVLPNLPDESTPAGGEENNVIVRSAGTPKQFDFPPKAHWDLAADLDLIDFARAPKLAGSGFILYKGLGAKLERALIQLMLDLHIDKHGYTEWQTPFVLNRESITASAHIVKFTPEMYHDAADDLFLLPTAEPALVNIHRDEILDGDTLPLNYVAYSPCWRREAGAAGKDTRGLLRVHQFDKVEMVKYTHPETSYYELEKMLSNATDVLDLLNIPYRIVQLAAGDLSFSAAKCYDIEAFAPGAKAWLEVSSCSNCTDFQARRAAIRFRAKQGAKPELVHLLNGSGTALPRVFAALLENHQNADGSINIPEALQPYLGGLKKIG